MSETSCPPGEYLAVIDGGTAVPLESLTREQLIVECAKAMDTIENLATLLEASQSIIGRWRSNTYTPPQVVIDDPEHGSE